MCSRLVVVLVPAVGPQEDPRLDEQQEECVVVERAVAHDVVRIELLADVVSVVRVVTAPLHDSQERINNRRYD